MTDDEKKPTEAPKPGQATPMPPSPADMTAMLTQVVQQGDPTAILKLIPGMDPKLTETLTAQMEEEKKQKMILAYQVGQNTEGVRLMAHAMDNWRDGVRSDLAKLMNDVELIRRVLKRVPAFADELDKLEIDRQNRAEVAAKVAARSGKSTDVTTSKPSAKSP